MGDRCRLRLVQSRDEPRHERARVNRALIARPALQWPTR
ncbi:hypothetical protein DB32_008278 [Sandaracinus amylolyticus]|uniref:Uncharacterized protein n=1 Tax=Sandaracinus amylolyticus TaxID=927083 RepID=A0A0F6SHW0_9BACT|nr:hypothetical protein DB32_008278 [Sandaracinus amylolyticus]